MKKLFLILAGLALVAGGAKAQKKSFNFVDFDAKYYFTEGSDFEPAMFGLDWIHSWELSDGFLLGGLVGLHYSASDYNSDWKYVGNSTSYVDGLKYLGVYASKNGGAFKDYWPALYIPVKADVRYYFSRKVTGVFANIAAGVELSDFRTKVCVSPAGSVGFGYEMPLGDRGLSFLANLSFLKGYHRYDVNPYGLGSGHFDVNDTDIPDCPYSEMSGGDRVSKESHWHYDLIKDSGIVAAIGLKVAWRF